MNTAGALRTALYLVGATLVYNLIEAVVALAAGANAKSIALVGFGLDSVIECTASGVMLWRLTAEQRGASEDAVERSEQRARKVIGITFLALAPFVAGQSAWMLIAGSTPVESRLGIALAAISLAVMPVLAWAKLRVAVRLASPALAAEAKETLACAYLSLTLLLGLGANAVLGWWWADPVAALLMVPWLLREGVESVRGEEAECGCGAEH